MDVKKKIYKPHCKLDYLKYYSGSGSESATFEFPGLRKWRGLLGKISTKTKTHKKCLLPIHIYTF